MKAVGCWSSSAGVRSVCLLQIRLVAFASTKRLRFGNAKNAKFDVRSGDIAVKSSFLFLHCIALLLLFLWGS